MTNVRLVTIGIPTALVVYPVIVTHKDPCRIFVVRLASVNVEWLMVLLVCVVMNARLAIMVIRMEGLFQFLL